MERPLTPPSSRRNLPAPNRTPPTPEVTRRIEENRLKAKALRERSLAATASDITRTPAGFVVAPTNPPSVAGLKRSHSTITDTTRTSNSTNTSTNAIPPTSRDARITPTKMAADDGGGGAIQAARKFKKYVDHDFSKMMDTKGGFLAVEDDPWNKALHGGGVGDGKGGLAEERPKHMSLKEWERHQLLKGLRRRKEGPFEPGLGLGGAVEETKKCRECGGAEIDWVWEEVFGCAVCKGCKEKLPERYSLLTKTEAKDDYLLTDPELKDPDLLPHLNKPNPHKSHWHDMMLFLRYQVEEYAFNVKWGSAAALDAEFEKREVDKKKRKENKFKTKLRELKKKTRTEAYRRNLHSAASGRKGEFGDRVGGERHEHEWGTAVVDGEGNSVKSCLECGMEVEELTF